MPDNQTPEQLQIPNTAPATVPAAAASDVNRIEQQFNQRFGQLDERLNAVLTVVASQATPAPSPSASVPPAGATNDDLWARAQQGDKAAFEEWTARKADDRINQRMAFQDREGLVDGQLRALMGKYPALTDATHPLTQKANIAFELMKRRGYPADKATLLDAAKTAIADSPEIVADMAVNTMRERARRGSVAQASMTGASHRSDTPPAAGRKLGITDREWNIAKRMGIENPEKARSAKERFLQRQERGLSSLGTVAAFVTDEGF